MSDPAPVTRQLVVLTGAKVVANAALRWVSPFLPVLERAFSTTTGTLTGVMGAAELAGLSTTLTGPVLDRGRERTVFNLGLGAVALSSLVALGGSVTSFAVAFVILILGVSNLTVAAHTWIGRRVPFERRSRSIGVVETSWALALLLGAPLIALIIGRFGWRGPFVALAVAAVIGMAAVNRFVSSGGPPEGAGATTSEAGRLPPRAWLSLLGSAFTAGSGISVFVVSGAWLDDVHGVSTAGLGLVAAGFGVVELASSSMVAAIGDRIGTRRSVLMGLGLLAVGVAVMAMSGSSVVVAVIGLLAFIAGFEFGFVSTLSLVTEAAPGARGRAIGIGNAVGTLARSGSVVLTGVLYERVGFGGSLSLAAVWGVLAFGLVAAIDVRAVASTR